ncbi:hypothetical protein [Cryobacterium sp. Y29]|uniref:hypothetical protein n=1 Tax=Cryobacterium sp. Y29 TaxID=2048285 RepID=UPI000CE3C437|nr:hypothetical protein [Cryobacterium sp. Y29]
MAKATIRKALIDRIILHDRVDDDGVSLRSGDAREAERYAGSDLDGRDLTGSTLKECEFS